MEVHMEYIINPSWFYWLHVIDGIRRFAIGVIVLSAAASIIIGISLLINASDGYCEGETVKKLTSLLVVLLSSSVIAGILLIFVPEKGTIIEMMIAKKATYDNVSWTIEQVKEAVDYVISAIKEIK